RGTKRVRRLSSCSFLAGTKGMLRKSWFIITGPTICTTSGFCAPGASCGAPERLVWACFVRLPWANIATTMPARQITEAIKSRRLKKAECEVDFLFIDEVCYTNFLSTVEPGIIRNMRRKVQDKCLFRSSLCECP